MSFFHHPLKFMSLFTILAALICLQMITIASSEPNEVNPNRQVNYLLQSELAALDNADRLDDNSESDENDNDRRSTSFLRFGRGMSPSSGSFLRFGRQISPSSGSFLRFGRSNSNFLRFGRGGQTGANFLRFGRRAQAMSAKNFHRFARKGEFLRFG